MARPGDSIPFKGIDYRLGEVIGQGYSGVVYALHRQLGKFLVAKVIQPRNESDFERWDAECQKLYQMRHPNITFMHSAFAYQGEFFIILERCHSDITRMGPPFSQEFIYSLARDLLQGLDFIHAHGFIHKDIHAGNIFFFRFFDSLTQQFINGGQFKIGDLGITKKAASIDPLAPSFAPWMIPPESLDLHFGQVCYATDIYHVALLLLAMCNEKLSLNFSHQDIWEGQPEKIAYETQNELGQVLSTALKRYPHKRYQSAFEFWQAIQSCKNWRTNNRRQQNFSTPKNYHSSSNDYDSQQIPHSVLNNYGNDVQNHSHSSNDYSSQDYDPRDYDPQDYDSQDYDPQDYDSQDYDPQDYDSQDYDPQDYESQNYDPRSRIDYDPLSSSGEYDPRSSSDEYDPRSSSGEYDPRSSSGEYDPRSSSDEYDPRSSSDEYDPHSSSGEYDPRSSSDEYDPRSSSGEYDRQRSQASNDYDSQQIPHSLLNDYGDSPEHQIEYTKTPLPLEYEASFPMDYELSKDYHSPQTENEKKSRKTKNHPSTTHSAPYSRNQTNPPKPGNNNPYYYQTPDQD